MLPLPAAVAISQIVALLGVEAVRYTVMATASLIKDIDFRLLYEQDIFQKAKYFRRFTTTKTKKNVALFFSVISLVIYFLPAWVAIQGNVLGTEYIYSQISEGRVHIWYTSPHNGIFKELINIKTKREVNTTTAILENYLVTKNKSTIANPSGEWHKVDEIVASTMRWKYDQRYPPAPQTINAQEGIFTVSNDLNITILTYHYSKQPESSSTLEQCINRDDPTYSNNLVTNFSNIDGHRVQAVRAYNRICYPITDSTLSLRQGVYKRSFNDATSVLENNDELFRSSFLHEQVSASVSADASILDLSENCISLLIKRKAHITTFYDSISSVLCRLPTNNTQDTLPYNQNIDSIVCQLTELAAKNPALPMFQATRRTIENNKIINSVYTYIKKPEGGHGILIDLTSISAFFIKRGRTYTYYDNQEILLMHQVIKQQGLQLTSNYHRLLQEMDPFPSVDTTYGQNTWTDISLAATDLIEADLVQHFFTRITATVTPALSIPLSVLVLICVLFAVFTIIIVIASMVASPIYKADLRKLLLSTLQYSLETKSNVVLEDGAIEMIDRARRQGIISDHNGRMDDLHASIFKYGEENKDKNQLLTMDDISIALASETEEDFGATEDA
jgi:hypothetical protein